MDGAIPYALRVAAGWSWRLVAIAAALWVLGKAIAPLSLLLISVLVAALLAALLSPSVMTLRKRGVRAAGAAAIAEIGMVLIVVGLLALTGQQLIRGFAALTDKAIQGYYEVTRLLHEQGLDFTSEQMNELMAHVQTAITDNPNAVLSRVSAAGSFAAEAGTGALLTLFALFFFLMEGENIWLFMVRLFPRAAQQAVNGAGRAGWKSLGAYVRVQILVAAIDAVGIGLGAAILGVPLAIPLGVLVFLGSFVPVIGALFSGAVAVLLALVALGPVQALIMLGIVLLVQQLESNILQPFIMGKAVSLHPLAVILAVAAGSILFGAAGALFAVPALALSNTVVRYLATRAWENDTENRIEPLEFAHEKRRRERAEAKAAERAARLAARTEALLHSHQENQQDSRQGSNRPDNPAQSPAADSAPDSAPESPSESSAL
ncbi:MAG: AI-2E family transporter [Rothia sp. (in: high G+C Gram-positive bacteria)]|nr:AI-2E family transporter [Rothia sp. (in: high G+C Gram-positive bacteria)]MDO5750262.1 AI-2E family transporter [Rothia sp. (in: high G+C Gram-positive bacteria)]